MKATFILPTILALLVLGFTSCDRKPEGPGPESTGAKPNAYKNIETLVASEELILSLTPNLKELVSFFKKTDGLVDASEERAPITYKGIAEFDFEDAFEKSHDRLVAHLTWPLESSSSDDFNPLHIWETLRKQAAIEDLQVGVLSGKFASDDLFVMETKMEGRFRHKESSQAIYGLKAKQTIEWARNDAKEWNLAKWTQKSFELVATKGAMFEDVTEASLPDEKTRENVIRSSHQELLVSRLEAVSKEPPVAAFREFADWESGTQFPAISVADIDNDGWDDILILDRWDKCVLLRNKHDGTFEDITDQMELDVKGFANCAAFFDADNDGDLDLFIGRTLKPSQLLINDDGKFVMKAEYNTILQSVRFVVAVSVIDINRDGLSDLYLSTYAFGTGNPQDWVDKMISSDDRDKMMSKLRGKNMYLDRGGPPNIVLMNQGNQFVSAKLNDDAKMWRNSFQSSWSDYDGDGDSDVYVCNDFSPDVFLRNDTPRGSMDVQLVEVTDEVMPENSMAFGMGASWGDYNNNGQMDLYVSNMFSKAGMRIVPQVGESDKRILPAAQGNFLYEIDGAKFKQVAGHGENDLHVSKVGWSFGGQFADFDNDSNLDIYVPSGYFSAPAGNSTNQDL